MLPAKYKTDPGFDPAEDHIGPFYFTDENHQLHYAFEASQHNCNTHGIVHGGVLMTFADYCLCMQATDHYQDESCITVSYSCEFVSAAEIGAIVECNVNVSRKTGSMVFLTGRIFVGDETVVTFSSVVKRLRS
ncbi:MAG: PaaI family thioesterase [bacterium]|nr:PaaI family thioesterase [Gammaproteobacteria bacterium]HIL96049.1 PaaI family thioesterase [Pseudomonadales bacterium]